MITHESYIQRCLQIAKNGLGSTRPNPMVGCVIVHNDRIVGEGYTSSYGGNHAEVNAINAVKNKSLLSEATLYVTLEPCSHYGKTPPCSDIIVQNKIPNVVIGCLDENELVAGKGVEKLKKSGCTVKVGILNDECKRHHKRFFTFHNKKRPYIILKWAQTADGFIAPSSKKEKKPVWITNELSRQIVHKWRSEEQAILVGSNTIEQDNPSLTVRDWTGQNPTRIILDPNKALSKNHNIYNDDSEIVVINSVLEAKQICKVLHQKNINSIIIEGGKQTLQLFIDSGLWDEARVFTGNIKFNEGLKAPEFSGRLISEENIEQDILKIYVND